MPMTKYIDKIVMVALFVFSGTVFGSELYDLTVTVRPRTRLQPAIW